MPYTKLDKYNTLRKEMIEDYYMPWYTSGFTSIQNFIDNIIANEVAATLTPA